MPIEDRVYRIKVINEITVRFHEVDAYNIVHNVHYFNYFDIGRFAVVDSFFRKEKPFEVGPYAFLVLKTGCKYVNYAQLGDELSITTILKYDPRQKSARIDMEHSVVKKRGKILVAKGFSNIGICDKDYKLLYRIPDTLRMYLREHIKDYQANKHENVKIF